MVVQVLNRPWNKEVHQIEIAGKLQDAVAVTLPADVNVVVSFRRHRIKIFVIGRQPTSGLPNGSQTVIRIGVEDTSLLQCSGVIPQYPGMISVIAVIRAKG